MSVGKQFQQLPMFMSAREIKSQYDPWHNDHEYIEHEGRFENDSELWDRKYRESLTPRSNDRVGVYAAGRSLAGSVLQEGVKRPVALEHVDPWWNGDAKPQVLGGHHRIEVMARHKPDDLMPVEHFDDFWTAEDSQGSHEDAEVLEQFQSRRRPR